MHTLSGMQNRTPGRRGVTDMWYRDDGTPTQLATPGTTPKNPSGSGARWRAWYIDTAGKQRTKKFPNKKGAERWADDQANKINTGTWVAPEVASETFATVAEKWYATKSNREATTKHGYRNILDTIVLPKWGKDSLASIDHESLQDWINELSTTSEYRTKGSGGFSASRTIQIHLVMNGVLKYAVRTERITRNPAEGLELPTKKKTSRQRYLTHGQLQEFAGEMGRFEGLTLLLGYCGARTSEAFGARGRDFRGRVWELHGAVVRKVEKDTKTHRARFIPVPEVVWNKLQMPANPDSLLFPGRKGHITTGEYRWAFDRALRTVQERTEKIRQEEIASTGRAVTPAFPTITPHDLRHTCASLAISSGANVKAVQNLLGHATAVMTLDLYGHLLSDDLQRVMDALDEAAAAA
ncbi:tyrosine integrase [Mycobacterium phage Yeet]|uniref:Integrase n=3 Tax=Omegavirus TaxID=1623292 RepID=A0A3S9UAU7_9CAUD|nr:integrase [Mycobacterium phage Redno2]YP_008410474.1 integrase [Mycobacterium phage Wanda]YP_009124037.1 integrase [Mycobacterium phage Minerva]YP_009590935.1 integrase [Mycobacterium phage Optimus]YP_009636257.1 integrase [Mycobacterium phage Baka]ATN88890.1 tyrosine integrase [Mycobacterium phage DmpstrDiver]ATN89796.1 tyrosine integrase [Mycobacterium phage Klein]AWH13894.1 tyrosine integrase [Mycobacterium phage Halley]AXQ52472.1 tyrosine integrase [Mycobacterium phage EricMillard]A